MDLETVRGIQKKKLAAMLIFAQKNTRFWGDHIKMDSTKDPIGVLKSLPILERETLKRNRLEVFRANLIPAWRRNIIRTSGTTTNSPIIFYGDKLCFLRMESAMQYILNLNDEAALMRFNLNFPPHKPLGRIFEINYTKHNDESLVKNIVVAFRQDKITHILGPTSAILKLAAAFHDQRINYPLSIIAVVGEHLLEDDRLFIQNTFGCRVFNIYASKEAGGPLAYECEKKFGWHMNNAHFYWEILDDENNEVTAGKDGNIVITMLENEVMPFIRYKIGDRGHMISGQCLCGRKSPRLLFTGRDSQFITLKDGQRTPLHTIVRLIRNSGPPIDQFQFEQGKPGEIVVKIVPLWKMTDENLKLILSETHKYYQGKLDIKIEITDKIPGKNILFINKIHYVNFIS